jgi:multicomponent Na+:H+ antiporter subunit D
MLSPKAMAGAMVHIAMHAFGKITLFFCAGAIAVATGKQRISEMAGIGRRMPVTMAAFFVGSLSIIGLPPAGGFISKWYLALGSLEADQLPILAVLLVSSLLNAAYFMPIVYRAFFGSPPEGEPTGPIQEWRSLCVLSLTVTAVLSVLLFFFPQPFFALATLAVAALAGG